MPELLFHLPLAVFVASQQEQSGSADGEHIHSQLPTQSMRIDAGKNVDVHKPGKRFVLFRHHSNDAPT
jgi:hypothetical protein